METTDNIFLSEEQFEIIFKSHIKIQTYPKSIDSLFFSQRMMAKINYKPYYQRNYVWDDTKATYFIESILLGTEIPPLIFFKDDQNIEVIDGRQRFETLKRFIQGDFKLSKKGLVSLIDFSKKDVNSFRSESPEIYQTFVDAKIRIFEFELINQPKINPILIDRLKKEIFARYNSGITPLKKAEIDNAIYDSDTISQHFKNEFRNNPSHIRNISDLFIRQNKSGLLQNIDIILQFVRRSLVLYKIPIKYYAGEGARNELISKFYEYIYNDHEDPKDVYESFIKKIELIKYISDNISTGKISPNRLFWECLLWSAHILEQEEMDYQRLRENKYINSLSKLFMENANAFELTDSHYQKQTLNRFLIFEKYIRDHFGLNVAQYVQGDPEGKGELGKIRSRNKDVSTELEKLKTLRITKPDPSRSSIEDIIRSMNQNRFLIRPTYQRSEVIDITKASAIIESILIGIMLPAIFIFKRKDNVREVIDGQQRLLTILGFIGEKYYDENNNIAYSKNNLYKLKNLRILKHLNGKRFTELDKELQDKILDFELLVVEIEEEINPSFNPVDLFIRLNDKPYPIKENSFEMWNSWVDKDIVDAIKDLFKKNQGWFYYINVNNELTRDRMHNEELLMILAYFDYRKSQGRTLLSYLDIYQKGERINARIKKKKEVTSLLLEVTTNAKIKKEFINSISNISVFLTKTAKLINSNDSNAFHLRDELDKLLSSGSKRKYHQRTFQDFYILWLVMDRINSKDLDRPEIYQAVESIFIFMKNIPQDMVEDNKGYSMFIDAIDKINQLV